MENQICLGFKFDDLKVSPPLQSPQIWNFSWRILRGRCCIPKGYRLFLAKLIWNFARVMGMAIVTCSAIMNDKKVTIQQL